MEKEKENRFNIADKISLFLNKYAKKNVNNDFIGSDSYRLEKTMHQLLDLSSHLKDIFIPHSEFSSGCYLKTGLELHEEILKDINNLMFVSCKKCSYKIERNYIYCPHCGSKN